MVVVIGNVVIITIVVDISIIIFVIFVFAVVHCHGRKYWRQNYTFFFSITT